MPRNSSVFVSEEASSRFGYARQKRVSSWRVKSVDRDICEKSKAGSVKDL